MDTACQQIPLFALHTHLTQLYTIALALSQCTQVKSTVVGRISVYTPHSLEKYRNVLLPKRGVNHVILRINYAMSHIKQVLDMQYDTSPHTVDSELQHLYSRITVLCSQIKRSLDTWNMLQIDLTLMESISLDDLRVLERASLELITIGERIEDCEQNTHHAIDTHIHETHNKAIETINNALPPYHVFKSIVCTSLYCTATPYNIAHEAFMQKSRRLLNFLSHTANAIPLSTFYSDQECRDLADAVLHIISLDEFVANDNAIEILKASGVIGYASLGVDFLKEYYTKLFAYNNQAVTKQRKHTTYSKQRLHDSQFITMGIEIDTPITGIIESEIGNTLFIFLKKCMVDSLTFIDQEGFPRAVFTFGFKTYATRILPHMIVHFNRIDFFLNVLQLLSHKCKTKKRGMYALVFSNSIKALCIQEEFSAQHNQVMRKLFLLLKERQKDKPNSPLYQLADFLYKYGDKSWTYEQLTAQVNVDSLYQELEAITPIDM